MMGADEPAGALGSGDGEGRDVRSGYKALTWGGCPPFQGGETLLGAALPVRLAQVRLDLSAEECGSGWNYCAKATEALRISGLWPDGRPARLFEVQASDDAIERGENRRASALTLWRELAAAEIEALIVRMAKEAFGDFAAEMAKEQIDWRRALGANGHDEQAVEEGLRTALAARHLPWGLRQFPTAIDAWVAATRWDRTLVWAPRGSARTAKPALDASQALEAYHDALLERHGQAKDQFTVGLREAYWNGLAVVVQTGPREWGWAMALRMGAPRRGEAASAASGQRDQRQQATAEPDNDHPQPPRHPGPGI